MSRELLSKLSQVSILTTLHVSSVSNLISQKHRVSVTCPALPSWWVKGSGHKQRQLGPRDWICSQLLCCLFFLQIVLVSDVQSESAIYTHASPHPTPPHPTLSSSQGTELNSRARQRLPTSQLLCTWFIYLLATHTCWYLLSNWILGARETLTSADTFE